MENLTEQEIMEKVIKEKTLKGPWPEKTHEEKHKIWFDNLFELLQDLESSDCILPRNDKKIVLWNELTIDHLVKWSSINSNKIIHNHGEINGIQK